MLLAAALFVLSALITLVVLAAGARGRPPAEAAGPLPQEESRRAAEAFLPGSAGRASVGVADFLLEEPRIGEDPPYLLRPPTPRWSEAQVERYWVPLKEVVLEIISGQSDRRIDELLRDVE